MEYRNNELTKEDYFRLRTSVGWNNWTEAQVGQALPHSLRAVTAVEDGHTVGMARLVGDGIYFVLVDVVVQPEYQGRGAGRHMVGLLLDWLQKGLPAGGRASVQLIAEPGKEPFYEALGFRRLPNGFCGSGMRRVFHKAEGDEAERPRP